MPHTVRISDNQATTDRALTLLGSAPDGYVAVFERRITIANDKFRLKAMQLAEKLKAGWVVKLIQKNRTSDQNALLWALLTDLSIAQPEGRKCTPDDWKCLVMHACGHDVQFLEGLDGKPFPVGFRSSHMGVKQMSDLIEWIYAYGADHGVKFTDPNSQQTKAA